MFETAADAPLLVCVIDDDTVICRAMDSLLRSAGFTVRTFTSPQDYLDCDCQKDAACLILDVHLGNASGLDFQQSLRDSDAMVPVILVTAQPDIPMTVRAMKAGAVNFLSKPYDDAQILDAVDEAIARDRLRRADAARSDVARPHYERLTPREREVMSLVAAGLMNKQVAARLGLSEITVKIHRGNMMRKMQAGSFADLVRMADALGVRNQSASRYTYDA